MGKLFMMLVGIQKDKMERKCRMLVLPSQERCDLLHKEEGDLVQKVHDKDLAAYIGMSPEIFSRMKVRSLCLGK
jgi:hypothetical protein